MKVRCYYCGKMYTERYMKHHRHKCAERRMVYKDLDCFFDGLDNL